MSGQRFLYSILMYLSLPLVILRLMWRSRQHGAYRQRLAERLALSKRVKQMMFDVKLTQQTVILVHTVSVGEAMAARPLVQALLVQYPNTLLWLTTTTPTGSDAIKRLWAEGEWAERVRHSYLPYDLPDANARFLNGLQPQLVLILETELWPNFYAACAERQLPLCLLNARLSERSFSSYQKISGLVEETLSYIYTIAARETLDAERFLALGAKPAQVQVLGNIKFDLPMVDVLVTQAQQWRVYWQDRPVWVAASTHQGEEALALAAHRRILQIHPQALLILVPRHPERFDAVATLVKQESFTLTRRSQAMPDRDTQVWLADSMGELPLWYASADIAFVGGSLVATGGHNPLEALIFASPVLTGPAIDNFAEVYAALLACGGVAVIESESDLAHYLSDYFADPTSGRAMGRKGQLFLQQHQGVVARILTQIKTILPPPPPADSLLDQSI